MTEEKPTYNGNRPTYSVNGREQPLPPARVMAKYITSFNRDFNMDDRLSLGGRAGLSYGGNRDLYKVLGYKPTLTFEDYYAKYDRQDMASRIVEAPAEDTWRDPPEILDGIGDEAKDNTGFTTDMINALAALSAWQEIENVDVLAGIGHYAVLLIGFDDGLEFSEPVQTTAKPVYLRSYDEGQATISTFEKNKSSARFGLPLTYKITLDDNTSTAVHWSRVIHVVEKARRSRVYGTPRMKRVFNRLEDLEKVVGGGAEAFWKLAYKGVVAQLKEGFEPPDDQDEPGELEGMISDYVNDIYRWLVLDGYEIKEMGGESVDPAAMVDVLVSVIAVAAGTPKRLLMGSELGRVASTQDAANWAGRIASRRTRFAEPVILRPLTNILIAHKVVTAPTAGYSYRWKPLFELDAVQQAQVGYLRAQTVSIGSGGLPQTIALPGEIREIAGLPGQAPDGLMLPGGERLADNVLIIRHTAEKLPATTDPLPALVPITLDDETLGKAIDLFYQRFPEYKGLLDLEVVGG